MFPKHYYKNINENHAAYIEILWRAKFSECYLLQQCTNALASSLVVAMNPGNTNA